MDFDIGNLVYILITLAFVIFSARKNVKKRVTQPAEQNLDNETVSPRKSEDYLSQKLKNIFGDYLDMETPVQETEEEIDESIYGYVNNDSQSRNVEYEEVLDRNYSILDTVDSEEGLSSTAKFIKDLESNNLMSVTKSSYTPISFTDEVLQDFDPRRAILFSEIFRPKYF